MLRKRRALFQGSYLLTIYKYTLGSPWIHQLPKSTAPDTKDIGRIGLPLPGRTLLITNVVSAALALLVEGRALFADEPEVEYLPRCEPRGAIVKEPAIPSVTVETIHLLFQAIEAILSPQSH